MDTKEALEQTVKNTADDIEKMTNGTYERDDYNYETIEEEFIDAYTLDANYVIDGRGNMRGAWLYMTLGGPTVWVDTMRGVVRGTWGTDSFEWGLSEKAQDWVHRTGSASRPKRCIRTSARTTETLSTNPLNMEESKWSRRCSDST